MPAEPDIVSNCREGHYGRKKKYCNDSGFLISKSEYYLVTFLFEYWQGTLTALKNNVQRCTIAVFLCYSSGRRQFLLPHPISLVYIFFSPAAKQSYLMNKPRRTDALKHLQPFGCR